MGETRIRLDGFEEALGNYLAANFMFTGLPVDDGGDGVTALGVGRHIFIQDMPEVEGLEQTYPGDDLVAAFNKEIEPTLSLYTEITPGVENSSSWGGKLDWTIRIALRFNTVPDEAKVLLEQLTKYVFRSMRGKTVGGWQIKGVIVLNRPYVFTRAGDQHAYATCVIRFLGVALPQLGD